MLNPILASSATRRMRSFRTMLIVGGYVLSLLVIAILLMRRLLGGAVFLSDGHSGLYAYVALISLQLALIVLITPAMTSGAIAGERDRQTLELLLVTQTGSFRIVAGKMMESFALLCLLLICGFPVMCLCLMTGAVGMAEILTGELFLLAMAFGTAAVGIFCSVLARTTVLSTVLSYLMIGGIGLVTALPMILGYPQRVTDVVYDSTRYAALTSGEALGMISPLLLINPGYGLVALLQGQTGLLSDVLSYRDWGRILATWKLMDAFGCERAAMLCAGGVALVGAVLLVLSALLLRPRERRLRMKHG